MNTIITERLFAAFIQCRRKAYLTLVGTPGQGSELTRQQQQFLQDYQHKACEHFVYSHRGKNICLGPVPLSVLLAHQCELATNAIATDGDIEVQLDALLAVPSVVGAGWPGFVPVAFADQEKVIPEHKLWLALCAAVLRRHQSLEPPFGIIIHGARFKSSKVLVSKLITRSETALDALRLFRGMTKPPPVTLTRKCAECDFEASCRAAAIEKDDLSLLQGLKPKDIVKLGQKGIFSITQLSYTFRPRKKSRRSNPNTIRYNPSRQSLAIREKTIYVVGTPQVEMAGTPVYLDVEGVPDRDSYYLIGCRFQVAGSAEHRSFWANGREEEAMIWRDFVSTIAALPNARLFHYGRYETVFLRRMKARYADPGRNDPLLDQLIAGAQNILSVIYGRVYFPTYSNSLKDIAAFLGFRWSSPEVNGPYSLVLRRQWEATKSPEVKDTLIAYNADDCKALELVTGVVQRVITCDGRLPSATPVAGAIHVDALKPASPYNWGPIEFVSPDLDHINKCAYWDYQRDRVYVRSSTQLKRTASQKRRRKHRGVRVNKTFLPSRPWECPGCRSQRIGRNGRHSRLLYDLRFGAGSIKRWVTKYVIDHYKCSRCGISFASDKYEWTKHRYGLAVLAYVLHGIIELHIPQLKLAASMRRLFGYPLVQPVINGLKRRAAERYREAYEEIKQKLLAGQLVHADATHLSAKSGAGYVWVFTSMEEVIYLWSETPALLRSQTLL